jgi:DNA-binding CsgD family transcriptional regulator
VTAPVVKGRRAGRADITPRQLEIMQLVADGHTSMMAAEVLGMAPNTAKTHMARILTSLGANSQAQAVAILMRRGLIR